MFYKILVISMIVNCLSMNAYAAPPRGEGLVTAFIKIYIFLKRTCPEGFVYNEETELQRAARFANPNVADEQATAKLVSEHNGTEPKDYCIPIPPVIKP